MSASAAALSKAKDTSVEGLVEAGVIASRGGKVRLLKPEDWNPSTAPRLIAWEIVHHLVRALESGGGNAAADFGGRIGAKVETARELCYRLYILCKRKKRAAKALSYNSLVQSWPEITRLSRRSRSTAEAQVGLFEGEGV